MSSTGRDLPESSFLVYGLGVTGRAVAEALVQRGRRVVAADDRPSEVALRHLASLGVAVHIAPSAGELAALVADVDAVIPTPGLPETHELFAAIGSVGAVVLSEFDLAGAWDDRPVVAITGTNGKTTTTMLVVEMLHASGVRAADAGNTEVPWVSAITDPDIEVWVVEASSFRLAHTRHFAPTVAVWLNFGPDHLDVHRNVESYELAKARIFKDQRPDQLAVVNATDPVVMRHAVGPAQVATFRAGVDSAVSSDAAVIDGVVSLYGQPVVPVGDLWRQLPHDVEDALAAALAAQFVGATTSGIAAALASFVPLAHRVSLVLERDGIQWVDDSKATTPHAVAAAVAGFDSVVLIAGGRNKGLDLSGLGSLAPPVRAVVGIGEAAADVVAAFSGIPGVVAGSMSEAVRAARQLAVPGDVVLLSPGCASFDWYRSYGERGDDFIRSVTEVVGS